jgi:hypothetical protein
VSFGFIRYNRDAIAIFEESPQEQTVNLKVADDAALENDN